MPIKFYGNMITPLSSMQFANMASMASPSPIDTSAKSIADVKAANPKIGAIALPGEVPSVI